MQTVSNTFYSKLDDAVTNWRDINSDPEFTDWLNQEDRYTPYTKMQLLQSAYANFNADKVVQFLKDFTEEKAAQAPQGTPPDPNTPPAAPQPVVAPGNIIAPTTSGRAGGTEIPDASQKPTMKRSAVEQFYKDKALRKLVMTPDQIVKKETEILHAMAENRIVPG